MKQGNFEVTRGKMLRRVLLAVVAVCALGASPASAAYDPAPGFAIFNFATGFPFDSTTNIGPVGAAFSPTGALYVTDRNDQNLYEFGGGGGAAGAATRVNANPYTGAPHGIAFGKDGRLYVAMTSDDAIVEVDPADGHVLRTVTTAVKCPVGLAVDPVTGDLFASSFDCDPNLWRIAAPSSSSPTVSAYAGGFADLDGIGFGPDGTLWGADKSLAPNNIVKIGGTTSNAPGVVTPVAEVPSADGIAIQATADPTAQPYLIVNRNDGNITKVDLSTNPPTETPVMSNGTRGDLVAVGPDHCVYATQTDRVLKVTQSDGTCNLTPTSPHSGPPPAEVSAAGIIRLPSNRTCKSRRKLRIRLVQQPGATMTSAVIYINKRAVRLVRGRKLKLPIDLTGLPKGRYTIKVIVKLSNGKTLTASRRYRTCTPKKKH